jgi:RimJ/RimL family protein N-acetyltransferase
MSNRIWEGKAIRLRAVEPMDWEILFQWNQDSERSRCLDYPYFPKSRELIKKWVEQHAVTNPLNDEFYFLIESYNNEILGSINTHHCDMRIGNFMYGIAIGEEHKRRGYATEAIYLVLHYFFKELRYQKVTVHIHSFNDPSINLHQRLGFQMEGRIRRVVFTRGEFFDLLVFGLTIEEFIAQQTISNKQE